jgi:hypothetical protein
MLIFFLLSLVLLAGRAAAATITLDFDTEATGLSIIGNPLVTSLGVITATNAELVIFTSDPEFNAAGASGNKIDIFAGTPAVLSFSFDAASISLIYGGNGGGILIEVLDSSNFVIDSFLQADTHAGQPAGPITLSGAGIRALRWRDTNSGSAFAALDNIAISDGVTNPVPEPSAVLLIGSGLAALVYTRRGRRAN